MVKFYDLSVEIYPHMPVWPTNPVVEVIPVGIASRDGYNVEKLETVTHTGTHVDAPYHFVERGITVEMIPLEVLIGPGYKVKPNFSGVEVTARDLEEIWRPEYRGSRIFIETGWSRKRSFTREFLYDFPGLSEDGADFLLREGVKLVGIDTLGIEPYRNSDFRVHKRLLGAGVVVVEDLASLDSLEEGKRYTFSVMPLRIRGASGSMARVVAWEG